MASPPDLTAAANAGEMPTLVAAIEAHYQDLRGIARYLMRLEGRQMTLQPTALVHEAIVRLLDGKRLTERGQASFKGFFARVCRNILVEQARARKADKRGGGTQRHGLSSSGVVLGVTRDLDVLEVDELLGQLAAIDARMAEVVEQRVVAGMTVAECAVALGVSERTVASDWRLACGWLKERLGASP